MRQERNNIFANIDWVLVLLFMLLVGFGWLNIFAASRTVDHFEALDFTAKHGKQLIWIALSFPLIVIVLFFNYQFYERFASLIYLFSIILLLMLFPFGKEINGAKSWFNFGAMSLQPSEFVKAFTALAVAKLLNDRQYNLKLVKNQIKAFIIIFLPAFLILLQPDAGSAIIYLAFFFVLNREGLTINYILFGIIALVLSLLTIYFGMKFILIGTLSLITIFTAFLLKKNGAQFFRFNWHKIFFTYLVAGIFVFGVGYVYENILPSHQKDRFDILFGKKTDKRGIGYNSYQSELTISSGGKWGKGFLKGDLTQGDFVPEQHTDYIFSTVGEEWGFLGTSIVVLLFMGLIFRIIYLSENQTSKFGRIYGYGVASILFFHFVVNIGMVIGLAPTVGIPLPFFSYGGSSLWGFTILLFIFIRLDAHKDYVF